MPKPEEFSWITRYVFGAIGLAGLVVLVVVWGISRI